MKKTISFFLAVSLIAVLAGCSEDTASSHRLSVQNDNNLYNEGQSVNPDTKVQSDSESLILSEQQFISLNLEITQGTLYIRSGNSFSLTRSDGSAVDYNISNNTLNFQNKRTGEIVLTLPENESYKALNLTVHGGHVYSENSLAVQSFNMDVKQGEVSLKMISVSSDTTININSGSAFLYGDFGCSVSTVCQNGKLNMQVPFGETDYNYEINVTGGNVHLGENNYHGSSYSDTINNGSERIFKLTCIHGDTAVEFERTELSYDYNKTK